MVVVDKPTSHKPLDSGTISGVADSRSGLPLVCTLILVYKAIKLPSLYLE